MTRNRERGVLVLQVRAEKKTTTVERNMSGQQIIGIDEEEPGR
jgi:hypothetical protein